MACAMRLARHLFFATVLLAYLLQVFGGMGLHVLPCLGDSCSASCEAAASHNHRNCETHRHFDGHVLPTGKPESHGRSKEPDGTRDHDPANCPVCQVLALITLPTAPVEVHPSGAMVAVSQQPSTSLLAAARPLGFRSRAPPV
jgi:hypothetical protein